MPFAMGKTKHDVQLDTFDPATFYPALAAREKLKTRDDSVNTFAQKSIAEPTIPKDFDPAVFYPALAAREKTNVAGREHSIMTGSVLPSSSTTDSVVKVERGYGMRRINSELVEQKKRSRRRLWLIGGLVCIFVIIIVVVIAYLGAHNWYKNQNS